ncbi:hypothetical protein AB0F39_22470 [Streptomyces murinus]|uniref:hypothetical protein n=1 Tax=Streptomyces murinus TaxID=33900 RepID=UPI0033F1B26C
MVMFEGYAGTLESGFAEEVAANDAVARLDYLEDIHRDCNNGGAASGGAAERISAGFERIRRELGDLLGVVVSPARLRTVLRHLTKTLHPGVLNDCFYQAATAVCRKRGQGARPPGTAAQHVPELPQLPSVGSALAPAHYRTGPGADGARPAKEGT